ncbi:MAG TPA: hypothetical protein VMT58_04955, partial [Candidatus Binataceae bacterium]|nr:hypothetical protein [Candidatus Binataceae bacterium]
SERAIIVPEAGCQCLSYCVGTVEIIAGPANPNEWREHPHRGGIPLLFPWPGRIAGGSFSFGGRDYRVPINEPARGHALHGLACDRPFRVARRGPYFVTAVLDSAEHADLRAIWPWPFVLEIDYEVGFGLRLRARIKNSGTTKMPFGFGAHPYFHAPLALNGKRAAMLLQVAADRRWPLDARLIPVGEPIAVAGKYDLRTPKALNMEPYDDAFQMTQASGSDTPQARLIDPALKLGIEILADPAFEDFVVYAPPGNPIIAIEPYTCAPDAFNLSARGIRAGVRELEPGATFESGFEIRVGPA